MPVRVRFKAITIVGTCLLASACASVGSSTYLHNQSIKEKTDLAYDSFSAIDDQATFFTTANELLDEVGKQRAASQRRRLDAIHNLSMATLIADNGVDITFPVWERAEAVLKNELRLLSPQALQKSSEWVELRADIEATREDIVASEPRVVSRGRDYRMRGGKKSVTCKSGVKRMRPSEPGALFYNRFVRACVENLKARHNLQELMQHAGIKSTEYHHVRDELLQQLDRSKYARKLIKDQVDAAKLAYDQESVTLQQHAENALTEKGRKLGAMLSSIDNLNIPQNDISVLGVDLAQTGDLVDGQTLADAIRADILIEEVEELIKIMSDPDMAIDSDVQNKARQKYLLILQSDTALRGIRAFWEADYPTPLSALVLLEHYRNQSAAYDRQVTYLTRQHLLSEVSAQAAEKKIEHLMNALLEVGQLNRGNTCQAAGFASYVTKCRKETTRVARALISMDLAHTHGTLPAELAFETRLNNEMAYSIETAQAQTAHVLIVLEPAIATLKAYGDGGIKSDTIAKLINTLSLISISVGVNQ